MTTNHILYRKLGRFDLGTFKWTVVGLAAAMAAAFILVSLIPQPWLDGYVEDSNPSFSFTEAEQGSRYLLVPLAFVSAYPLFTFVTGIVSAAETRSFIASGATREAIWRDGRRTNVGMAVVLFVAAALGTLAAILFDGGVPVDSVGMLSSSAILLLTMLVAFEIGYFISLLFIRYHWLLGVLACVAYSSLLLLALSATGSGTGDAWPWYSWVSVGALTAVAFVSSRRMMSTVPMRRSH